MAHDLAGLTIVLVGPGRAGRAFARSWTGVGGAITVLARDVESARDLALGLARTRVLPLENESGVAADLLILAVADDAIGSLAASLAPLATCRFAFHFSGALGSGALAPLSARGARLGSLHPLRAFAGSPQEDWRGTLVAVEGEEPAVEIGAGICESIGARPRRLSADGKPLYHAAATLAAGGTASLLSFAVRIWAEAGLDEEEGRVALAGLASSAVEAAARLPFDRALTGPVARRDVETIRLHRNALSGRHELARLYALLASETLRATAGRGREREIAALLGIEDDIERNAASAARKSDTHGPNG